MLNARLHISFIPHVIENIPTCTSYEHHPEAQISVTCIQALFFFVMPL